MELVDPAHSEAVKAEHGSPIALSELPLIASRCRETYMNAKPWPHLVLDNLVDPDMVAAAEAQELQRALNLELQKWNRMIKAQSTEVTGQAAQQILDSLLTPQFVSFLEEVTGIARLIPDPSHAWAGIHVSPPGSFQVLHRDFRLHPQNGLFHRVNVLVYLNSDWKEEYGGKLELWSTGKHALGQQVSPVAGKLVLFETTPFAFHGVPDPVRCPPERARISLASYYYTDYPAPTDRREWIFYSPKRPQDPWYLNFRPPRDSLYSIVHPVLDLLRRGQSDK